MTNRTRSPGSATADAAERPSVILVTGGDGAIGQAVARSFLAEPATRCVHLGVRHRRDAAEALAGTDPARCRVVDLDVTSPEMWDRAIAGIVDEFGRLDVLVNNAGFHRDALLATMDPTAWSSVIDANLTGVFHGCRSVIRPMMANRFGRIVNVSSLSALLAPAGQANYAAAKAGLLALSQSLAKEVARAGITVNSVCPGYIESDALGDLPPDRRAALAKSIPMRRLGTPEEVAAAIRFLSSTEASYITGAVLKIDGGIF